MNGEMLTKCSVCGAQLLFKMDVNIVNCSWCGRINERPKSSRDEPNLKKLKYANERRNMGEFDEAEKAYRDVLAHYENEHEARWGILLCKYGVIYVEGTENHKRLITCRKEQKTLFSAEDDYHLAMAQASPEVRKAYKTDAQYIDEVQRSIRTLKPHAESYDVFLCYKETASEGGVTEDAGIAQAIYQQMTKRGYHVFYAKETLAGKAGANYEAVIYLAIEKSRAMLVIGTRKEYFNSVYVRSEWRRFKERMNVVGDGEERLLVPLFRTIDDLPDEIRPYQGYNMNLPYMEQVYALLPQNASVESKPDDSVVKKIKLVRIRIRRGEFQPAEETLNPLFDEDPENAEIWLLKAMIGMRIRSEADFANAEQPLTSNLDFVTALELASGAFLEQLKSYQETVEKKLKEAEDKARKEAEEKARKEAEEKARKEAEEKARWDAMENKTDKANCCRCGEVILFKTGNDIVSCPMCGFANKRPRSSPEKMDSIKARCSICGSEILFKTGNDIVKCPMCERINVRPKSSRDELNLKKLKYANELRNMGEFAQAEKLYQDVLAHNVNEYEARWGILLCKYGVVYEEGTENHKRLITCRRFPPSSFRDEPYYQMVLEQAAPEMRAFYEKDAEYIDRIQEEMRQLRALDEKPYDVFLCYMETATDGARTEDSRIAANIYQELIRNNYRVFYPPVSLMEKAGTNFEAAIFCAVETSRVMLVLGTKKDYFESPWVRSEWQRYLEHVNLGDKKRLIPLFRNATDLPDPLRIVQGIEIDKPYYLEDVKTCLGKFISSTQPSPQKQRKEEYKKEEQRKLELANEQKQAAQDTAKVEATQREMEERARKELKENRTEKTDYEYAVKDDGSVKITGYKGSRREIVIPSELGGRRVTSIGDGAFKDCSSLTSVTISNGVTIIGDDTFSGCSSLAKIMIPSSVTYIGKWAFSGCSSLTNITIPNSVTYIGGWAFSSCSSLTNISIPNSVTQIRNDAFLKCSSLTSVTIPGSVTSIGEWAFSGCSSLTSVIIPNSVISIDNAAFYGCNSLSVAKIPQNVTTIEDGAFENCKKLTIYGVKGSEAWKYARKYHIPVKKG